MGVQPWISGGKGRSRTPNGPPEALSRAVCDPRVPGDSSERFCARRT